MKEPNPPKLLKRLGRQYLTPTSKQKSSIGEYLCSCGKTFTTVVRSPGKGLSKSCGCYQIKRVKESNTTHGRYKHPLHKVWISIVGRTVTGNSKSFRQYASKGINLCDRWLEIDNFIEDMYPTYTEGLTIERRDSTKDYSPDNCYWATMLTQSQNRGMYKNNTSGFKGVRETSKGRFTAIIHVAGKAIRFGPFNQIQEAALARDKYIRGNSLIHHKNFTDAEFNTLISN